MGAIIQDFYRIIEYQKTNKYGCKGGVGHIFLVSPDILGGFAGLEGKNRPSESRAEEAAKMACFFSLPA